MNYNKKNQNELCIAHSLKLKFCFNYFIIIIIIYYCNCTFFFYFFSAASFRRRIK